jgi:hypothetical protein
MTDLTASLQQARQILAQSRARMIHAVWAVIMRLFREPA